MINNLTVTDPLSDQNVSILITLPAGTQPREKRPLLLSLGTAGRPPVTRSGTLADVAALIHEAWTAFGLKVELADQRDETETVAEVDVVADEPPPVTPKPRAQNLSLF